MRKLSAVLLILLLACSLASASLSINTAWDVRPTVGSSVAGGGFVQGATGTNMAIFDNKNAAACSNCQSATVNISTTDGVTAGTTNIVSATGNYSSALVGNIVYIAGGTGSVTASRYQVISVTNATTFVVDRTTGLTAGTGVTINIGGALDVPATAINFNTAGNRIFVKASGTLTVGAAALTSNNNETPGSGTPMNTISGYSTVWGDCRAPRATGCAGGAPTIQATSGSGYYIFTGSSAGWVYENFNLDCNGQTNVGGVQTGWYSVIQNMKVTGCLTTSLFANGNQVSIIDNEVTGATSTDCIAFSSDGGGQAHRNYVHDAACGGISNSGPGFSATFNVLDTLTGIGHNGFNLNGRSTLVENNTVYNVTAACIQMQEIGTGGNVRNNILHTCGSYGILSASAWAAYPSYDGNLFYATTTADRHFVDDAGAVNPIDAAGAYTNVLDIPSSTCTTDPLTNAAGADFSLGTTACATLAKGTGSPGKLTGLTTSTGYISFGAFQPQFGQGGGGSNSAYVQ